jgi:hypothetical protein
VQNEETHLVREQIDRFLERKIISHGSIQGLFGACCPHNLRKVSQPGHSDWNFFGENLLEEKFFIGGISLPGRLPEFIGRSFGKILHFWQENC